MPKTKCRKSPAELGERNRQLETALTRIASEIERLGIGPRDLPVTTLELPGLSTLTAKEWEVFISLCDGARTAAIAKQLGISASTARNHLKAIFRKLGVTSQLELLALLLRSRDRL